MIFSEMQTYLRFLVDDVVDSSVAAILLNAGQDKMAVEVKCTFPKITATDPNGTFVFPEKYHEMPVLYAAAMYKTYDSSVRESDALMGQFLSALPNFSENYQPPYRYWDDFNVQQFTSTDSVYTFKITKEGYNRDNAEIRVYVNDVPVTATASLTDNTFTIGSDDLIGGQYVTVIWEVHADLNKPPYGWWEDMP